MGNKHSEIQVEASRKQVKDTIVLRRLQDVDSKDLPAPRKGEDLDIADASVAEESFETSGMLKINLSENKLNRVIGKRPSVVVREKIREYQKKEAEEMNKTMENPIKRLLFTVEKDSTSLCDFSSHFEEYHPHSPIPRSTGNRLFLPRSVSVTKQVPTTTHTLKLLRPKKPVYVLRTSDPAANSSLSEFLKATLKAKAAREALAKVKPISIQKGKSHTRTPVSPMQKRQVLSFSDEAAIVGMTKKEEKVIVSRYKLRKNIIESLQSEGTKTKGSDNRQTKAEFGWKWIGKKGIAH